MRLIKFNSLEHTFKRSYQNKDIVYLYIYKVIAFCLNCKTTKINFDHKHTCISNLLFLSWQREYLIPHGEQTFVGIFLANIHSLDCPHCQLFLLSKAKLEKSNKDHYCRIMLIHMKYIKISKHKYREILKLHAK